MSYPVYSFGMVAPSVLHVLKDAFPDKDAYAEMRESFVNIGGEAANSSIVLARLGVKTKLDGNRLGKNQKGKDTLKILKGFGINVSRIKLEKGYEGVSEMVISDHHTRTNFGSYCKLLFEDKKWNRPVLEDIAQAEIDPVAQPGLQGGFDIRNCVRQSKGDLLDSRRAGLAYVITGNADGVPMRHLCLAEAEQVGDQAHGGFWREDIRAAGDIFF